MRLIIVTFGFLGWGFYELSGGSEFSPETLAEAEMRADQAPVTTLVAETPLASVNEGPEIATRQAGISLVSVTREIEPRPALATTMGSLAAPTQASVLTARVSTSSAPQTVQEDVILFESLVDGAPTAADLFDQAKSEEVTLVSTPTTAPVDIANPYWEVAGSRVNMRDGPSTNFGVIATLTQGTQLIVIESQDSGWAQVEILNTGQTGWMAQRLLTPAS